MPGLKRQVLDVEIGVEFKCRKYNGKQRKDVKRFRLVAVYNIEVEKYPTYITNIPADRLDGEDIALLYSARWEVELIFKELKSRYGIDILPMSNPQVVEALIWVGILTPIVSRRVYLLVYSANLEDAPRYTHLRWVTIFAENHTGCSMRFLSLRALMPILWIYLMFIKAKHLIRMSIERG